MQRLRRTADHDSPVRNTFAAVVRSSGYALRYPPGVLRPSRQPNAASGMTKLAASDQLQHPAIALVERVTPNQRTSATRDTATRQRGHWGKTFKRRVLRCGIAVDIRYYR